MPFLSVLAYWIIFSLLFPTTYTIEFRGETVLANRADSLAGVVQAEIDTIQASIDQVSRTMKNIDETFKNDPEAPWYMAKQRRAKEVKAKADSMLRERVRELEALR